MKKIKKSENKAGIWIDQKTAMIIHIAGDGDPIVEKIKSGVEFTVRDAGEKSTPSRFGPSYINEEVKQQHRQKNEREKYFKKIISLLQHADSIYIFGPSDARYELVNDIEKDPVLKNKYLKTEKADRMTDKQVVQHVVSYFKGKTYTDEKKKLRKTLMTH